MHLSLNDSESCLEWVDGWTTATTTHAWDWDWTAPSSGFNLTHFNASKPNISVSYTMQDCDMTDPGETYNSTLWDFGSI